MPCEDYSALKAELIEALTDVIRDGGMLPERSLDLDLWDSCANSRVAHAMRRLAAMGRFEITSEYGRRVFGRFVEAKG